MKPVPALVVALASGLALSAAAQTPAPASATAGPKVAVIEFQAAVTATNEFQRDFGDLQKKFEPQRTQLKTLSDQVETLTKQLQATGTTLSDADRAAKAREIDEKKKQAQRLAEDAQNDYQQQIQDTFSKVAAKVDEVLASYSHDQGFTVVLDATEQQQQAPLVLYASPNTDITRAIVEAYNVKSGIPAPPAPASSGVPSAPRPSTPRPSTAKPPAQ